MENLERQELPRHIPTKKNTLSSSEANLNPFYYIGINIILQNLYKSLVLRGEQETLADKYPHLSHHLKHDTEFY